MTSKKTQLMTFDFFVVFSVVFILRSVESY
nr:MAG TPA: hypothetical protein [Caudoviricetes sp.]